MLFNQNNLNVAKFASKTETRPALSGVLFTKDKTVATDSFSLIEMSVPSAYKAEEYPKISGKSAMRGMKPVIINAEYIRKNIKIKEHKASILGIRNNMAISHIEENKVEVLLPSGVDGEDGEPRYLPRITAEQFPDYEKIFPTTKPVAEVELNGEYLANLLEVMSKLNNLKSVKIKFFGNNMPLMLESKNDNQTARGLLMPLRS